MFAEKRLDLSHVRPSAAGTTSAAARGDCRAGHEDGHDDGGHVASPAEPEERRGRLGLAAALLLVERAICDLVVAGVGLLTQHQLLWCLDYKRTSKEGT